MTFRLFLTIILVFIIPGWAFLAISRLWKNYSAFQRWLIAVSLSIAFYPILFYLTRFILPDFQIGIRKLGLLLLILIILIIRFLKSDFKKQFRFQKSEWLAIIILLFSFSVRYYLANEFPFPAWSDSLHHTILTNLVATSGRLPTNLEPFAPISLDSYHLGLYSLTGVVELFSKVPAHVALQWTMQTLSALSGIGIYLVLDRKIGRKAAITGLLVASLLSFQPNWYFNWGRDTQLASQVILLSAWLFTWESFDLAVSSQKKQGLISMVLASSALNAGVFLLHFRVAAFYFPLILLTFGLCLWQTHTSRKSQTAILRNTFFIGLFSLIFILPAILPLTSQYNQPNLPVLADLTRNFSNEYYAFSFHGFLSIGLRLPLLILTIMFSIFAFIHDRKWTLTVFSWIVILIGIANIYRLGIPFLNFTNAGAIYIMFYIPASLLIGSGVEYLYRTSTLKTQWKNIISTVLVLVVSSIYFNQRIHDIEPYRWFITDSDLSGMDWINQNTSPEAVFGINTYFWLEEAPHGTDGGYWIPYFTNRKTTSGFMLNNLGTYEYRKEIIYRSLAMEAIAQDSNNALELCEQGIDYIFIGEKGDFSGDGLDKTRLIENPLLEIVFENGATSIIQINCP